MKSPVATGDFVTENVKVPFVRKDLYAIETNRLHSVFIHDRQEKNKCFGELDNKWSMCYSYVSEMINVVSECCVKTTQHRFDNKSGQCYTVISVAILL